MLGHGRSVSFLGRKGKPLALAAAIVLVADGVHSQSALAVPRIAVIGEIPGFGAWCDLLEGEGYECSSLPNTGPEGSLESYDVVIDLSYVWSDPEGLLAEHMRAGKGVITWAAAPKILGIDTDPVVQGWIGANASSFGSGPIAAIVTDPILGDYLPGTNLETCNDFPCPAVGDTSGHPNVKVLAIFGELFDSIGILRNRWEGGQSVYFTFAFMPVTGVGSALIVNAVRELAGPAIPTVSQWGVVILTLLLVTAGSIVIARGRRVAAA